MSVDRFLSENFQICFNLFIGDKCLKFCAKCFTCEGLTPTSGYVKKVLQSGEILVFLPQKKNGVFFRFKKIEYKVENI